MSLSGDFSLACFACINITGPTFFQEGLSGVSLSTLSPSIVSYSCILGVPFVKSIQMDFLCCCLFLCVQVLNLGAFCLYVHCKCVSYLCVTKYSTVTA